MRRSLRYGTLIFREFRRTNEGMASAAVPVQYQIIRQESDWSSSELKLKLRQLSQQRGTGNDSSPQFTTVQTYRYTSTQVGGGWAGAGRPIL